ncbi:phage tail length tape measure family protein [Paraburkholderia humisilvae]|uniref:Bacteriophage tail tape measure C-terminal domain-containing protein n=1 Tax=Paraburkholderia humisilvae TaxID=627669 RepID=A0A6J5D183_9BURK|nr:phage tail length tape measure family protein [Paraburkholderia humisilvae]CAB3746436.1 hypothetical protein LMG29542_00210 [Paraburkholderia humisilvae]
MAQQAALVENAMREAADNGFDLNARAAKRLVQQYQQMSDTAGKTRLEMLNQRAAAAGVSNTFAAMSQQIEAATAHTHGFSLNSGAARRELAVLAHEASQGSWKNFGGSLLVLAERTDALSAVFSAAGVTAGVLGGALAGVIAAYVQGAAEAKAFTASLVETSNYAGITADMLNDMSSTLSANSGSTFGTADKTLRELAATGQYTSEEMLKLGQVIVTTALLSGKSLEDVAKQYDGLADDPVKWAEEHNKSMHLMDVSTYEHIKALQDAGDKHAALQGVIDAATQHVASTTTGNLANAQSAWQKLGNEISTFWAKLKQGLSTGATLNDQIETLEREREAISGDPLSAGRIGDINKQIAALGAQQKAEREAADTAARNARIQEAAIAAQKRIDTVRDQVASNAEKRQKGLAKLDSDRQAILAGGGTFDDAQYTRLQADINARYKDPKPPHVNESGINANLTRLRGYNQLIEAEEQRSQAHLKAIRSAGLIDNEAYLQQLHDLQASSLDQQISNAYGAVQEAAQKKNKAAEQAALTEYQKLVDQRVSIEQKYTDDVATLAAKRVTDVQRYDAQQAEVLRKQVTGYANTNSEQFDSPQQRADNAQRLQLREQYNQQVVALDQKYKLDPTSDKQAYADKLASAASYYQQEQAALEANLANQQQVRDSYTHQTHLAVNSIAGDGMTGAETVATAFKSAWSDSANALSEFVATGKGSFASFTSSVLADFSKIALQAAEMQIFKSVSTSFFSTGGEVGHYADGGSIVGAGTGTSDSIPAMLSNGEYVINAASTKKYRSLLESINSGHMSHFATGGAVGTIAPAAGGVTNHTTLQMNVRGGGGLTQEDVAALQPIFQAAIDKRITQRFKGQGGLAYQMKYGQA